MAVCSCIAHRAKVAIVKVWGFMVKVWGLMVKFWGFIVKVWGFMVKSLGMHGEKSWDTW